MEKNFTFKVFNKLDEKLEHDWNILENEVKQFFFQKFLFIKTIVETFNDTKINIVVLYEKNKPIAIFPLEIKRYNQIKILQWIGTNQSDYCCPIVKNKKFVNERDFKQIWNEILDTIKDYDIIFLNKQPEYIEQTLNPFAAFIQNTHYSIIYQTKLVSSENDYLSLVENKKFSSELRRTKKKLLEKYKVIFKTLFLEKQKDLIEKILFKKDSHLKKKKISNSVNQNLIDFYKKLSNLCPKKLMAGLIQVDGKTIAASIGIIENKRFYYLVPVIFTEEFNSFSPGKILINYLINWTIKNDLEVFDFGIGEETYKKYWSNYSTKIFRHLDYRGVKGFLIFLIIKIYLKFK
jgi:CelD/BcsL family acetyltransferase involved in cellulose biosynthesis